MTKDEIIDTFLRGSEKIHQIESPDISQAYSIKKLFSILCEGSFLIKTNLSKTRLNVTDLAKNKYPEKYTFVVFKKIIEQNDPRILEEFVLRHQANGLSLHPLVYYELKKQKFKIGQQEIRHKSSVLLKNKRAHINSIRADKPNKHQIINKEGIDFQELEENILQEAPENFKPFINKWLEKNRAGAFEAFCIRCIDENNSEILNKLYQHFLTARDDTIWQFISISSILKALPTKHYLSIPDFWLKNGLIFERKESLKTWLEIKRAIWPKEFAKTYQAIGGILLAGYKREIAYGELTECWIHEGGFQLDPFVDQSVFSWLSESEPDQPLKSQMAKAIKRLELRKEIYKTLKYS